MNAPNPAWSIQCENGLYLNQFSNKQGAIGKPERPKKYPIWAAHPRTHLSTKYPPWGPGPVTHKDERGNKGEKRKKKKRKKEERKGKKEKEEKRRRKKRKGKKRREEREEDLRPIWAGYSVFRLCTSLYTRPLILQLGNRPQVDLHITDIGP